jgi:hypothetical protein
LTKHRHKEGLLHNTKRFLRRKVESVLAREASVTVDSSGGEAVLIRLDFSLNLDRDSIVHGYDSGRRPRRSLRLFSLRPGAHPTFQDRFAALHLDAQFIFAEWRIPGETGRRGLANWPKLSLMSRLCTKLPSKILRHTPFLSATD